MTGIGIFELQKPAQRQLISYRRVAEIRTNFKFRIWGEREREKKVLISSQLYQHKIEGCTLMCFTRVALKSFKCCVVSVVFMTLSASLQRKIKR